MHFKTGLVLGGIVGYLVARELARHGAEERPVSVQAAMSRHPSARGFTGLANRASTRGVEAIQRARATIQRRLVADSDDLSMN